MWIFKDNNIPKVPIIILCAGQGKRLLSIGEKIPKSLVPINNKPIIKYVVDYWKEFASEFIFVVGYKKEQIISLIENSESNIPSKFVVQEQPKGIAHAIGCTKDYVKDKFIVVLSDCMCRGNFSFPEEFKQGVGVWKTKDQNYIKQSYSIDIDNGKIIRVVEKPKIIINDLCGMGYYFFDNNVFEYIEKTPPSTLRNEIEITDVIQQMINYGENVTPIMFEGEYLNITSPEDISIAEQIFV